MLRFIISGLGLVIAALVTDCHADAGLARITKGATGKEVMTLVGEPTDRLEREIRREQVWLYPTGTVVFSAGRARSVYLNGSDQDRFSEEYLKKVELAKPVVATSISSPVEDILTEILREVPSEAGTETGPSLGGASGDMKPVEIGR